MPELDMTNYPELAKSQQHAEESETIGAFLGWLQEQHLVIARTASFTERLNNNLSDPTLVYHNESINQLLARYFDIDLEKMDKEQRALIAQIRK